MSYLCLFFCFKQKTAYEMRISDWSSDVCSSDLMGLIEKQRRCVPIDPPADRPKARNAQTSNVYRMSFPNRLARFLPRFLRPVPLPDDVVQREIDRIEEIETMRLWRTPRQVV